MSEENVELARRFHDAQQGDIEAAMEFVAEDVVAVEYLFGLANKREALEAVKSRE